jgi:hypothetical protein
MEANAARTAFGRRQPNGQSGGAATDVRRNPVADRAAAGTTRAGMTNAGPKCARQWGERYASVQATRRGLFPVAERGQKARSSSRNRRNLANVGSVEIAQVDGLMAYQLKAENNKLAQFYSSRTGQRFADFEREMSSERDLTVDGAIKAGRAATAH